MSHKNKISVPCFEVIQSVCCLFVISSSFAFFSYSLSVVHFRQKHNYNHLTRKKKKEIQWRYNFYRLQQQQQTNRIPYVQSLSILISVIENKYKKKTTIIKTCHFVVQPTWKMNIVFAHEDRRENHPPNWNDIKRKKKHTPRKQEKEIEKGKMIRPIPVRLTFLCHHRTASLCKQSVRERKR